MKFLIAFSVVVVAATALPAPVPALPIDIGADNLQLNTTSRVFLPRNSGLNGFGASSIGGAGGAVWTVWDPWALRDALNSAAPRIVFVRGRIDLTRLFVGSPGVSIRVGPYKSIIGGDANAEITGGGLQLVNQVHVIIQNIKFSNALSYAPGEMPNGNGGIVSQVPGAWSTIDCVDINESEHVWVDHCEFSDDPWNALSVPEERRRHNGLLTIKRHTSWTTISNNVFRNHNMNFLIGHNDGWVQDIGRLKVSIYLNWFQGVIQRNPRVRYGEVHVLNNLFTDCRDYGIGAGIGAHIYVERNAFVNTRRAWMLASSTSPVGNIINVDNRLTNSAFDSGVPNNSNFNPNRYYSYNPMPNSNVEAHVRNYAGTW